MVFYEHEKQLVLKKLKRRSNETQRPEKVDQKTSNFLAGKFKRGSATQLWQTFFGVQEKFVFLQVEQQLGKAGV